MRSACLWRQYPLGVILSNKTHSRLDPKAQRSCTYPFRSIPNESLLEISNNTIFSQAQQRNCTPKYPSPAMLAAQHFTSQHSTMQHIENSKYDYRLRPISRSSIGVSGDGGGGDEDCTCYVENSRWHALAHCHTVSSAKRICIPLW